MEELEKEYMNKISDKLHQLGLPNKPENKIFCMIYNELRELNFNIETILDKLKKPEA